MFSYGHFPEYGGLLRQISYSAPGPLVHRRVGQLHTIQQHSSFVGPDQTCNKVEGRGLSRAVGPEQPDNLPLLDPYADMIDHRPTLEALPKIQTL